MPTHRIADQCRGGRSTANITGIASRSATIPNTERAVLAVLAGEQLATAAARIGITTIDLADAIETYQAAGRAALQTQAASGSWYQVHVQFVDWDQTENTMAEHLWPRLRAAETDRIVSSWWYIRKAPCWRLRFLADAAGTPDLQQLIASMLDDCARQHLVTAWWPSSYEPETCAFGGTAGIETAHRLFHADSTAILEYLIRNAPSKTPTIGRRELSMLLYSALLRAANQDWHEQGDIWHRVTLMRPIAPDAPRDRLRAMASQIHRLISLDTRPERTPDDASGPLTVVRPWLAAFVEAGHSLGTAAYEGTLQRGIRDVLAHHIIFHWNRLGLTTRTQGILAHAAFETIMMPQTRPDSTPRTSTVDVARA